MLVVVRHGRTALNAAGLLQGRIDPPVDEHGAAQAARIAGAVPGATRVVSSPLLRARQTAAAFGLPVEIDDRWVELDYGVYDGRPLAEVPAEVWAAWRSDPDFVPEGGESLRTLFGRVVEACEALVEHAAGHDVVVVSHVLPIKAAVCWALGVGVEVGWRCQVDQASITRIACTPRGPALRSFNEVGHLI